MVAIAVSSKCPFCQTPPTGPDKMRARRDFCSLHGGFSPCQPLTRTYHCSLRGTGIRLRIPPNFNTQPIDCVVSRTQVAPSSFRHLLRSPAPPEPMHLICIRCTPKRSTCTGNSSAHHLQSPWIHRPLGGSRNYIVPPSNCGRGVSVMPFAPFDPHNFLISWKYIRVIALLRCREASRVHSTGTPARPNARVWRRSRESSSQVDARIVPAQQLSCSVRRSRPIQVV